MKKSTYIEFQKEHWEHRKRYKDPRHRLTQAFVVPKIDYIRRYVDINSQTSLLDVGAGNGIFTYYWADIAGLVVGVDYAEKMIKMSPCRKLLLQADATVLPFKDNSFDVVFCSNLLHHVGEPIYVVKEMKRVTKKYVILLEPNRSNFIMFPFGLVFKEERGLLKFSKSYLKNLIKSTTLKVLACHSMGLITQNNTPTFLIRFLRLFNRRIPFGAYTILIADGIIGWYLNGKVLKRTLVPNTHYSLYNKVVPILSRMERRVRPPFGLSLVTIAETL